MLKTEKINNVKDVRDLLEVHLHYDQPTALEIGMAEVKRLGKSDGVRAVWYTALFIPQPGSYILRFATTATPVLRLIPAISKFMQVLNSQARVE